MTRREVLEWLYVAVNLSLVGIALLAFAGLGWLAIEGLRWVFSSRHAP